MSSIVNKLRKQRPIVKQFLKFGVTGTVGAIVDFGTYNILTRGLGWDTVLTLFGFQLIAANMVSVLLAILSNFFLNKYWTFRDPGEQVLRQGISYFGLNTVTWVLNQLLTSFFVFQVPFIGLIFGSQRDNAGKALAVGCIMFINFFGSKFLIFRKGQTGKVRAGALG